MSTPAKRLCTPEEIAEKKRRAVELQKANAERRKQRKLNQQQTSTTNTKQIADNRYEPSAEAISIVQSHQETKSFIPSTLSDEQRRQIELKRLEALKRAVQHKVISPKEAEKVLLAKTILKDQVNSTTFQRTDSNHGKAVTKPATSRPTPYEKPVAGKPNLPSSPIECHLEVISETRFSATLERYNETVINEFKKIKSKHYDLQRKLWSFNIQDYKQLCDALIGMKQYVTVKKIPDFVLKLMRQETPEVSDSCLSSVEPKLRDSLYEFQLEGALFGIAHGGRFLLADDMGLGKTRQALVVADYFKDDWPLLIVTTAQLRQMWLDHIFELMPSVNVQHVSILESKNDQISEARIVICSYSGLEVHMKKLEAKNFNVILFDESQAIKNRDAKQTRNATTLGQKARRVVLISGTPAMSRPVELYTQLNVIDEKFFGSYTAFIIRYCQAEIKNGFWDVRGSSNLNELNFLLRKKFMIRRMKNEVLDLKPKHRSIVKLENLQLTKLGCDAMKQFAEDYRKASEGKKKERHTELLDWFHKTAVLKSDGICRFVEEKLKESSGKLVIFAYHQVVLDDLSTCLQKNRVRFIRIDGQQSNSSGRHLSVRNFQEDPDVRCALLSIRSCATGITMTAASHVIFAELDWTPNNVTQSEGRVHRIGQESQVEVTFLIAPNTVDEFLWDLLISKQRTMTKAITISSTEYLSQAVNSSTFQAGPSKPIITNYFNKSEEKEKSPESKVSSQSFHTCQDFDDVDYDALFSDVESAEQATRESIANQPAETPKDEPMAKEAPQNEPVAPEEDFEGLNFDDDFF